MAKLPSGWTFIPRMRMYGGKITIELEERKLVTCAECKFGNPTYNGRGEEMVDCLNKYTGLMGVLHEPNWFCADGEANENAAD